MTDYVSPLVFLSREYLLAMGTVHRPDKSADFGLAEQLI
jgi:hypothetical protein